MEQTLLTGSANPRLAETLVAELGTPLSAVDIDRFPDGELHVEIQESVRGHDVYLIQPTSPPAEGHLFELLILADAANRAGAARLTALIPYLGHARQDRRVSGREAVGARMVADLIGAGGLVQRVVVGQDTDHSGRDDQHGGNHRSGRRHPSLRRLRAQYNGRGQPRSVRRAGGGALEHRAGPAAHRDGQRGNAARVGVAP